MATNLNAKIVKFWIYLRRWIIMCELKIGWSNTDITPIGVIGKKVSLIGQFHERITSEVRDPIHAVALAIEAENGQCAAIVSLDLCQVTEKLMELTRKRLAEIMPNFPLRSLILAATHIHTGPHFSLKGESLWGDKFDFGCKDPEVITPQACIEFLSERIASAVDKAWRSRVPGGLAFRVGRIAVPQCRRVCYKDGSAAMYGNTDMPQFLRVEGNADNGAEYIVTYDTAGRVTGSLINLACPAQVIENKYFISADMWGSVRRQWPECPYILPLCGAAGDITMRDLVRRYRMEAPMNDIQGMDEQAGRIVRESKYVLSTIKPEDIRYDLTFAHITREIMLPIRTVTEEQYLEAKMTIECFDSEYDLNGYASDSPDSIPLRIQDRVPYSIAAGTVNRYKLQAKTRSIEMELHALRIGDSVLVNNAFELYQDYGMQIKARSPSPQTIITQLSCGNMGYLPTSLAISGGSYSANVSNGYAGPEGGAVLVEKTLDAIGELFR
jgi:hypothetical protein